MRFLWILLSALLGGTLACRTPAQEQGALVVSIKPQTWFLNQLLGEDSPVVYIIPSNIDPEDYQPALKDIIPLEGAKAFFTILSNTQENQLINMIQSEIPELPIFAMQQGINQMQEDGDLDPHIWLNPALAQQILLNTKKALEQVLVFTPEESTWLEKRYRDTIAHLQSLDARIRQDLAPFDGREVYVYHPEFAYFLRHYGLTQISLEKQDMTTSIPQFRRFIEGIEQGKVNYIIAMHNDADAFPIKTFVSMYPIEVLYADPYQNTSSYEESLENLAAHIIRYFSSDL